MSFRDNLQHLRATRNMTQEQLAMLVGVSRQSVTKWEAEKAYPEMDKLLKLCQIFDCSLDELVQGDLTARAPEEAVAMPAGALAEDVVGYDEHYRSFASRIAVGVACCILGMAVAAAIEWVAGEGAAAVAVFAGVAVGLFFIIPAAMEHSAFRKAHPYIANFYDDDQRMAEQKAFGVRLAVGICFILVGAALEASFDDFGGSSLIDGGFLGLVSVGVGQIVFGSIMANRLDIEGYNISSLEELDQAEIALLVGEDRAAQVLQKVQRGRRVSAVCGVIMLLATIIALPLMFWGTQTHHAFWSQFFWLPWMVGGLLCAVASIVMGLRGDEPMRGDEPVRKSERSHDSETVSEE